MPMSQLAIIADDTTGAADTGAPFALAGFRTILALDAASIPAADVLLASSESRHLSPQAAYTRVHEIASRVQPASLVYKKMDSTLRGHPAAELNAAMDALGISQALVAPAFPAQGRTTVNGRQLVSGVPLERTAFAGEIETSDVLALFRQSRPVHLLSLAVVRRGVAAICSAMQQPGILVADAETDDDLAVIAQASVQCEGRLLCGSAGLALALVQTLPAPLLPSFLPGAQHATGAVLIVAGSRHPRTRRQVYAAGDSDAALITPDCGFLTDRLAFDHLVETTAMSLASGHHTVLSTLDMADSALGGDAVAAALARVVQEIASRRCIGALILTGGDIAAAVLGALRAPIWLLGQLESGIPWGVLQGGLLPGIPVITKAGGFGHDDALAEAIEFLTPLTVA